MNAFYARPVIPLLIAGIAGGAAYWMSKRKRELALAAAMPPPVQTKAEVKELSWDDVQPVDLIGLEVGYRLIPLVDKNQGGQLMTRIKGVRKKLSQDLGFLIPPVHIRDNLELNPNQYRITLMKRRFKLIGIWRLIPARCSEVCREFQPPIRHLVWKPCGLMPVKGIMRNPWVIPWLIPVPWLPRI